LPRTPVLDVMSFHSLTKGDASLSYFPLSIHVIELLCYNWRFANFWLEIWSHNRRFFIDVFEYILKWDAVGSILK
jgi:hypothetical protein